MTQLPLPTLLSQVLVARTRDLEADIPEPSLPMWANLLRIVGDGAATKELPVLARVSRRAMKSMVTRGVSNGWVTTDATSVRLTDAGRAADEAWRAAVADDWIGGLRAPLASIVGGLSLELPHYPVGYGTADPRITGGIPHGQDWRPVHRAEGDTVSGLPLLSLLSQALVAFTWDYEQRGVGALPFAANVLRLIGDDGVPLDVLDPAAGVQGNGKSNLERHGFVTVDSSSRVRLTELGRGARDVYAPLVAEIEQSWRDGFGAATIDALRAALGGPDPSLPHHPLVVFTPRGFRERSRR